MSFDRERDRDRRGDGDRRDRDRDRDYKRDERDYDSRSYTTNDRESSVSTSAHRRDMEGGAVRTSSHTPHNSSTSNSYNVNNHRSDDRSSSSNHRRDRSRSRDRERDRGKYRGGYQGERERERSSKDRDSRNSNEREKDSQSRSVGGASTTQSYQHPGQYPSRSQGARLEHLSKRSGDYSVDGSRRLEKLMKEEKSKVEIEMDAALSSIDIEVDDVLMTEEEMAAEADRKREERKARLAAFKAVPPAPSANAVDTPTTTTETPKNEASETHSNHDGNGHIESVTAPAPAPSTVGVDIGSVNISSGETAPQTHAASSVVVTAPTTESANATADDTIMSEDKPVPAMITKIFNIDAIQADLALLRQVKADKETAAGGFDMFSSAHVNAAVVRKNKDAENVTYQDNFTDKDGYYKVKIGEVIAVNGVDRYVTRGQNGSGMFSVVIICDDLLTNTTVAIKMIRNNETMRRSAQMELKILNLLKQNDPEDKKRCVRLLDSFDYKNHVCMVFERMHYNLREIVDTFGRKEGIKLDAVRKYARQLFYALHYLATLKIIHGDLKPDNVLVDEKKSGLKVCDLGSAMFNDDPENLPTPYLVSRFYRAPEIILGLEYDTPIDIWAAGTCLYELFTGHVLFNGSNNNEMLKLQQDRKGKFPNKMLKAHFRAYEKMEKEPHFEPERLRFRHHELDPVSGEPVVKLKTYTDLPSSSKDLNSLIMSSRTGESKKELLDFVDLVDKCCILDPSKRISAAEAMKHPFLSTSFK